MNHSFLSLFPSNPNYAIAAALVLTGLTVLMWIRWQRRHRQASGEGEPTSRIYRPLGIALAIFLPAVAFGFYLLQEVPGGATPAKAIPETDAAAGQGHDILKMIQKVEERTRKNPKDADAWALLGRTYAAVKHWPEALYAYEKAYALKPDVPSIMTGYAEALAIQNGRALAGKPLELVQAALEKDPNDLKGLELAGYAAFQDQGYAKAAFYFKQLVKLLPPNSPYAQDAQDAYREANRLAHARSTGLDNLSDPGPASGPASNAKIRGVVDIEPRLKDKVGEKDTVFLFARGMDSGIPVAVLRNENSKLPLEFELNDHMARTPEQRLSRFKEVELTARVSRSGEITAKPGDLEGSLGKVKIGSQDVRLVIDRVVR